MPALDRETGASGDPPAGWRAGLPILATDLGPGVVPTGAIGAIGLLELRQTQPRFVRGELGFFLDPAVWGTGLFSEAAPQLLDCAFHTVGVHRIEARARVDNLRSNMALRRLGARHEGTLRAALISDGQYVDQYLWAIVGGLEWVRPRNLGKVRRE